MKKSRKMLALILSLTVAFTMCFCDMSFAFAEDNPQDEVIQDEELITEPDVDQEVVEPEEEAVKADLLETEGSAKLLGNFTIDEDSISPDATLINGFGTEQVKYIVPDAVNKFSQGDSTLKISVEVGGFDSLENFNAANAGKVKVYELPELAKGASDFDFTSEVTATIEYSPQGVLTVKPEIDEDGAYAVVLAAGFQDKDGETLEKDNAIIFVAGPDLVITYGDESMNFYYEKNGEKGQMFYVDGGEKVVLDNKEDITYSGIRNTGNNTPTEGAYGPDVLEMFKLAAGEEAVQSFDENQFITFNSNDGYTVKYNWENLFGKTRYYFPNSNRPVGEDNPGDLGIAVEDSEWDDAVEVPVIIDLNDSYTLSYGQRSPSERNQPGFNKNMGKAGVKYKKKKNTYVFTAGIANIVIEDKDAVEVQAPSIVLYNDQEQVLDPATKEVLTGENQTIDDAAIHGSDDLAVGDKLALTYGITNKDKNGKSLGYYTIDPSEKQSSDLGWVGNQICYYTVDGSKPDLSSAISNYDTYNWVNAPYTIEKAGTLVFKAISYNYEGITTKDSISTTVFEVSGEINLEDGYTIDLSAEKCAAGEKPAVSVKDANGKVLDKDNYSLAFTGYKKLGTATVKVSGKNVAEGSLTAEYTVIPAKASFTAKAARKAISVTIGDQKASGVTKYQIYYKKSGSKAKYKTVTSEKYTIKKLMAKKKYTVKVRAYGKTGYGAWSAAKTVKTR